MPARPVARWTAILGPLSALLFNYADGLREAFPDGDRHAELVARVREIRVRFERAAAATVAAGCREIQVVAHSLGTVIGGLMSSHTAYNGNAAFLGTLAEGLGGPPPARPSRAQRVRRAVWAALQNLALPLGLLVLAALGLALMLTIGSGVGWILGRPLEWLGFDQAARWVANGFALFVAASVVIQAHAGALRARDLHDRFWSGAEAVADPAGATVPPAPGRRTGSP